MAKRILLIADDHDQSQLFSLVLERAGYQVTPVFAAEDALALFDHTTFDLILTDYLLPDINGDELIPMIRGRGIDTKIVMMSNHVDVQYIARRANADGCFAKDDIFKLTRLVTNLLGNGSPMQASA